MYNRTRRAFTACQPFARSAADLMVDDVDGAAAGVAWLDAHVALGGGEELEEVPQVHRRDVVRHLRARTAQARTSSEQGHAYVHKGGWRLGNRAWYA